MDVIDRLKELGHDQETVEAVETYLRNGGRIDVDSFSLGVFLGAEKVRRINREIIAKVNKELAGA